MYDSLVFTIGYVFDHYLLPGLLIGLIAYYIVEPGVRGVSQKINRGEVATRIMILIALLTLSTIAAFSIDEIFRPLNWVRTGSIRQLVDMLIILVVSLFVLGNWPRILEAVLRFFRHEDNQSQD